MSHKDLRPLVAHVVYRFDIGGLENGVVNLINRMPAGRYRHAVVALTEITDFRGRVQRDDVRFVELRKPPGQGIWQLPRLRALFSELQPAIVHTRNIGALEASLPALIGGVPVRIHGEHGWDSADPDGSNWKYLWTRRAYRFAVQHWIALSSHIEDYLQRRVGVPATRLTRICNGVDIERFRPSRALRETIEGSPFNDPALWVIGTVGRLQSIKDQVTLVRALAHSVRASSEARRGMRLVIAGDGPQRAEVEATIGQCGLSDHVWVAGRRDDVPEILRGLNAFALPSLAEGISNTVLEAMASGLPLVATRVGGTPDLVDDGRTGILVPPADPRALGDAILQLFTGADRTKALGAAARAECERRLSLDSMVSAYGALYDRLLAHRGARVPAMAAPEGS